IRDFACDLMRAANFDVYEALNGSFALDQVIRNDPDVIVVDLNMPIMDGMRFLEMILRKGFPASRIIVHSATLDKPRLLWLASLRVRNFFVKPVDPTVFTKTIEEMAGICNLDSVAEQ